MAKQVKKSKFSLKRKSDWQNDYEPAYENHFKCECKRSNLFFKINDYNHNAYFHIDKHDQTGKSSRFTLRLDEFYNVFASADKLVQCMNECCQAVKKKFGVVPGSNEEQIDYECIPKSQRTIEMEKSAEEQDAEEKLFQEFKRYKKEIQEAKEKSDNDTSSVE